MQHLLLAIEIDDIIKVVLVIIFVFGGLISQVVRSMWKSGNKPAQRPTPRPSPQPPREAQSAAGEGRPQMSGRDRAFLDRLEQERRGERPREVEVLSPPSRPVSQPAKPQPVPPRPMPSASQPVEAEVIEASTSWSEPIGAPLSGHNAHLGEVVGLADEKLEAHLHATFTPMGTGTVPAVSETPAASAVAALESSESIRRMLASPESIRDAFVLSEILRPPVDRW